MILLIETSSPLCSVAVCDLNGKIVYNKEADKFNSHAEQLPLFANECLNKFFSPKDFKAVAICNGPGSYTGLRIGTSLAKGICYSLEIPLISADSFLGIAQFAMENISGCEFYISLMDARRDDVYAAVFNQNSEMVFTVKAITLGNDTFSEFCDKNVCVCGNATEKWKNLVSEFNAISYLQTEPMARFLCKQTAAKFQSEMFEDVAYFEPYYLKDFIPGLKNKGRK